MRTLFMAATAVAFIQFCYAQGGSGAPSPVGQTVTPRAASAAERSVEARHDKLVARSKAKAAAREAKAASASDK